MKTVAATFASSGPLSPHATQTAPPQGSPKLLDQLRQALRSRHYSRRTEQTYCQWVKRFICFHGVRHPAGMAEPEINTFLTALGVKERVSASTQNQALSALLFLYRHVLNRRAKRRDQQTCHTSHVSAFFRDTFVGGWV